MGRREPIDALIVNALSSRRMHGYAIAEAIRHLAEERELYAALHRLELDGVLTSEWGIGEDHRRAKYYRLREARAPRTELLPQALALMSIVGVATGRGAPPAKDRGPCAAVAAPVTFSGRIGSVRVFVDGAPRSFVIDTASV